MFFNVSIKALIYLKKTKSNVINLIENIRVNGEDIYLEGTPYKFVDKMMRKNSSDSKEENSEPIDTKEEDETIKKEEGNPQNLSEAVHE